MHAEEGKKKKKSHTSCVWNHFKNLNKSIRMYAKDSKGNLRAFHRYFYDHTGLNIFPRKFPFLNSPSFYKYVYYN